jgi:drug/metabolite transporter (DMT)-like permease
MAQAGSQVALGLGAAAAWGGGDFSGGLAAKRAEPPFVVATAHAFSLLLLVAVAVPLHAFYAGHEFYGLSSGVLCGGGLIALYSALARGSMGLTAATSGVLTALIPVIYSLVHEAWLHDSHASPLRLAGFAVAAVAIWLVAYMPASAEMDSEIHGFDRAAGFDRRSMGLAVVAGLSFGTMLILMHLAAPYGVLQALIEMRVMSTSIAAIAGIVLWLTRCLGDATGAAGFPVGKVLLPALIAGVLDTGGNLLYLFGSTVGRLDVTAVISSLYPAGTMLLAALLLKERATKIQAAGMVLAITAIVMISV